MHERKCLSSLSLPLIYPLNGYLPEMNCVSKCWFKDHSHGFILWDFFSHRSEAPNRKQEALSFYPNIVSVRISCLFGCSANVLSAGCVLLRHNNVAHHACLHSLCYRTVRELGEGLKIETHKDRDTGHS